MRYAVKRLKTCLLIFSANLKPHTAYRVLMPKLYKETKKRFFIPGDPNDAFLEVVHLEPRERKIIGETSTVQVMRLGVDGKPEERIEIDMGLDREETAVKAVRNWSGYLDVDGKEMECNEVNKRYWSHDPEFMASLNGFLEILAAEVAKERKAAAKN